MRVLHLSGELPPRRLGGVSTYVENVARRQRERHEVGVVFLEGESYVEDAGEGDPLEAQALRLDLDRLLNGALVSPATLRASVPLEGLLGQRWDVLHAHDWYGTWPALALAPRAKAVVMTAHLPLRFGFSYANHALPFREKSRLESLGYRISKRVIAPSRYVAAILEREYDVPRSSVRVVHNGVDTARFVPADGARAPIVLSVSRLSAQKGLTHLLAAFERVRAVIPDARLEIAGDGPERARLERLAGEGVRFLGHVPHAELPALYGRAAVFVSASLHEPFGLTTLEAMACGTPVVVSPLGGTAELVDEGESGLVRPPHDPAALAGAIAELLGDPARRDAMGRAAAARAHDLDWAKTVDALEACYAEALG